MKGRQLLRGSDGSILLEEFASQDLIKESYIKEDIKAIEAAEAFSKVWSTDKSVLQMQEWPRLRRIAPAWIVPRNILQLFLQYDMDMALYNDARQLLSKPWSNRGLSTLNSLVDKVLLIYECDIYGITVRPSPMKHPGNGCVALPVDIS